MIFSIFHLKRAHDQSAGVIGYAGGTGKYTGLRGSGRFILTALKSLDHEMTSTWEGAHRGHYRLEAPHSPRPGATQ